MPIDFFSDDENSMVIMICSSLFTSIQFQFIERINKNSWSRDALNINEYLNTKSFQQSLGSVSSVFSAGQIEVGTRLGSSGGVGSMVRLGGLASTVLVRVHIVRLLLLE